jgi:hypothetical protein
VTRKMRKAPSVRALKAEIVRLKVLEDAVKAQHNGYDPEFRKAHPKVKEPSSPLEALKDLQREAEELHECEVGLIWDRVRVLERAGRRLLREMKGLTLPCTRHDYSVGKLDEVVMGIAKAAVARYERDVKREK